MACAPWHLATHELQQQIEEAHPISISTSTKKQWLVGAATFLSTKYASFWHDLLEARTSPPAPPAAPSRTGLRPRPNAPSPPPARILAPADFVREVVTMPGAGDTLHVGQVSSYDASLRMWHIKFPTRSPTTTTFNADDMARYGPPNTTCPPQPGTSQHTIAAYLHAGRTPGPAWFTSAPKMSPYRRRLWAKLSTNSDFAVCRGKRGCASHQLCSCKMGAQTHTLEDAAHVCFECEYYSAIRRPLQAAATAWCQEAGTPPSKSGLAGAIHWAATDRMPQGAVRAANPAAGDSLRDSAVAFYAKAMAIRYNKSNTSSVMSKAAASQPPIAD